MIESLIALSCFAIITAIAAHTKGFSSAAWAIYGLLFGPFALLVVLIKQKNEEELSRRQLQIGTHKKCPFCAEFIKVEATVCKHCHKAVSSDIPIAVPAPVPQAAGEPLLFVLGAFSLVVLGFVLIFVLFNFFK